MADQYQHPMTRNLHESSPSTRQIVRFLTAAMIGISLLVLSAITLTGTVIGLIVATPLMVLFSPVLVPAVITIGLLTAGFLFSGGCGVAAATVLSWMYMYLTGKHPMGSDKVDYAIMRVSEKARELGHYGQPQTQQTTTTNH
ncbi:hypothetical protein V5N11_000922 [Cardamine amara subsp. amara]|uniref:Oleosin n=1 Tax=Cardamine amara subsp. amara TaxID=228776 RepID=A0ABD1C545_CARAN